MQVIQVVMTINWGIQFSKLSHHPVPDILGLPPDSILHRKEDQEPDAR